MTEDSTVTAIAAAPVIDGLVLYADGSFRQQLAGWGIHGYAYCKTPMKKPISGKQYPTEQGYQEVPLTETVSVVHYIDAFGDVKERPTNNTGELWALINALRLVPLYPDVPVVVLTDSEYVVKGYTKYLDNWIKANWQKSDGETIKNVDDWKVLADLRDQLKTQNREITVKWVKGHSGNLGNDYADMNARTGSGGDVNYHVERTDPDGYHKAESESNPLTLKTRMLFNTGPRMQYDSGHYYYLYQLGKQQTYGNKQGDSTNDRHNKTDLLLGRRISDATFCVLRLDEPDQFLDRLQALHTETFQKDIIELAIARLDNAYRPIWYQRLERFGRKAFAGNKVNDSLVTPYDDLITKTLNPPRLALEAVDQFSVLQRRLDMVLTGAEDAAGLTIIDITDQLYRVETQGKKSVMKLLPHITNNLPYLTVSTTFKDNAVSLKLVLGIDIPVRNTLAKLADERTKVNVVVVATGPFSYSFATVFQTAGGDAIYQSPYTQFVIPKSGH